MSNLARQENRRPRPVGTSVLVSMLAVLVVAGALMPFAAGAPAPDLVVDEASIAISPASLVEGVEANITFSVSNVGSQNAFSFNITLWDQGSAVGEITGEDLFVGLSNDYNFLWTPSNSGTYDLRIQAWYGPTSAKQDENWDDNNATISVDVRSRPDAYVYPSDLSYTAPNIAYVVDGDMVTLKAVLHNSGTADVTSCNVNIWEARVGPMDDLIGAFTGVTIPGAVGTVPGQTPLSYDWNTTSWSGKRHIIFVISNVAPNETGLGNNMASIDIKVHTVEDLVFQGKDDEVIDTAFKVQFFITIKDEARLTIKEDGNATIFQDFDDQYDIVIMDEGVLEIDGGILSTELNFTVYLSGGASLIIGDGSNVTFRIVATGSTIVLRGCDLKAPSLTVQGGKLTIDGSALVVDSLTVSGTEVEVHNSTLILGNQLVVDGQHAEVWDTEVTVARYFESYPMAVAIYPVLEFYNVGTHEVKGLPPAIMATNGAVVDLYNVSAHSLVLIKGEGKDFWTGNRLGAMGRTAIINVHRYLLVEVRDWSDQPIAGAFVEVLDYFNVLERRAQGTTDEDGNVLVTVRTDYIRESQKPYTGNLQLHATADSQESEYIRFSHSKYPDMAFGSNLLTARIVLPPKPHPPIPATSIEYTSDFTIEGLESGADKTIIITDCTLTLKDTMFTLEQEMAFEWYILVRGDSGVLKMDNSTLWSLYVFVIYLEDGGRLSMSRASAIPNARIIASDDSSIVMRDSIFAGGIYADCEVIELVRSELDVTDTILKAGKVSINGGYIHESIHLLISGDDVEIIGAEVTADYRIGKALSGFRDIRTFWRFFGWGPLNNLDSLTNITKGYFSYFASECNITIEVDDTLIMSGAFVYAPEVNILVRRTTTHNLQTTIEGSWIGGLSLVIISDDMYVEDTNFNRVLDGFAINDRATLMDVEVPGIVCRDNALVKRYWFLTVHGKDNAGSLRPFAVLEVMSTETGAKLRPEEGKESYPESMTDETGTIVVPILANTTNSSGDYYVGSIRCRLMFNKLQFVDDPIYTDWRQLNMKANTEITMTFKETIESLQKEILYVVYNVTQVGPSQDLKLFYHTFPTDAEALSFLNETMGINPDRVRLWTAIKNESVSIVFKASARINDKWVPLKDGTITISILDGPMFDPAIVHVNIDGTENGTKLKWGLWPDDEGYGNGTILFPDIIGNFQFHIEITGGIFDPIPQALPKWYWNFTVVPPQTIEIDNAYLSPDTIILGTRMQISGTVLFIYGGSAVENAEITVTGNYISTGLGRTDEEGRFTIQMQAPIVAVDNLTLTIFALDPVTSELSEYIIHYSVVSPPKEEEDNTFNWQAMFIVLIILGIVFAAIIGSFVMYRRHYGDLVECGECGAFIPAASVACPKCGIDFETDLARCSECEAWIPANSSSCPVCGIAFTIESLERQVLAEEADEEMAPIDEVTTSTSTMAPLHLDTSAQATRWSDKDEKRRRRIKKRVKKRLTVAGGGEGEEGESDEAHDLFVGDEADETTRLPGLSIDEASLSDDELSRLLPTEDMLRELMLTSEAVPASMDTEELEGEENGEENGEEAREEDTGSLGEELEEIPPPGSEDTMDEDTGDIGDTGDVDEGDEDEDLDMEDEDSMPESRELLSELGLMADVPSSMTLDSDLEAPDDMDEDSTLGGLLDEDSSKEAPKLCPNCGGNWILYKEGEYTCRICGEHW